MTALRWISLLATTTIGGWPARPSPAASKPSCLPAHCRAVTSPTRLAIVAPLVSAPAHSAGSPKSSFSQRRTTSSVCAAAGLAAHIPAFWSIADASQSPASAAGVTPPLTKPKKRGPGEAVMPRSARANHSPTTPAGSLPCSGSTSSSALAISCGVATWLTGRCGSEARKAVASAYASRSAASPESMLVFIFPAFLTRIDRCRRRSPGAGWQRASPRRCSIAAPASSGQCPRAVPAAGGGAAAASRSRPRHSYSAISCAPKSSSVAAISMLNIATTAVASGP
ncbi:MAG: hypothetical protein AW07_02322 [Candidatus Accumulibacter sp. SK-11]|nr:MAG: hypothetical protein AW07_02322 [Candidatus Accumulibacter sp. SK-11]